MDFQSGSTGQQFKLRRQVTVLCLLMDLALVFVKFGLAFWGHSRAMAVDGLNSFMDSLTGVFSLWVWWIVALPADENHSYGHGKFETLSALFFSIFLVGSSVLVFWGALDQLIEYTFFPRVKTSLPSLLVGYGAVTASAIKVVAWLVMANVSKKCKSSLLWLKACDYRSDAFVSAGVALSVFLAPFVSWGAWLDPLVAIVMSGQLIFVGLRGGWQTVEELVDGVSPSILQQVAEIASQIPQIKNCHALRARQLGVMLWIECHLTFDDGCSLATAHQQSHLFERKVKEKFGNDTTVTAHLEPESEAMWDE